MKRNKAWQINLKTRRFLQTGFLSIVLAGFALPSCVFFAARYPGEATVIEERAPRLENERQFIGENIYVNAYRIGDSLVVRARNDNGNLLMYFTDCEIGNDEIYLNVYYVSVFRPIQDITMHCDISRENLSQDWQERVYWLNSASYRLWSISPFETIRTKIDVEVME